MRIPRAERTVGDSKKTVQLTRGARIEEKPIPAIIIKSLTSSLDRFAEQRNNQALMDQQIAFDEDWRKFKLEEMGKTGLDADGAVTRTKDFSQMLLNKQLKDVPAERAEMFQSYVSRQTESFLDRAAMHQVEQLNASKLFSMDSFGDNLNKNVGIDPTSFASSLEELEFTIDNQNFDLLTSKKLKKDMTQKLALSGLHAAMDNSSEEGEQFLKDNRKYFTQDQIDRVKDMAIRKQKQENAILQAQDKEMITQTQDDFVCNIKNLTVEEVIDSNLPPTGAGSKEHFLAILDKQAEDSVTEENTYKTDPEIMAQIMMRNADENKAPMSTQDILSYMGAGLSPKDAASLVKAADSRRSDSFKNTENTLKAQFGYEGILKGFGSKQIGAIYYNKAMTEINDFLGETPLRGGELRAKMNEIAAPYLEDYMKDIMETPEEISKRLKLMGARPIPPATNMLSDEERTYIWNPKTESLERK